MSSESQPDFCRSAPLSKSACHSFHVPSALRYWSRPTSVNAVPWYFPETPSWSGVWSSKSSALSPILRSSSPLRTTVERQKLQTANGDAAERNSTGAPQFGHAAR